ncbi:MAG: PHP domain-containing protein [Endomicrobia bacterium]|nr:PHP domain-containing protein [Endomicrobiia bacterium]
MGKYIDLHIHTTYSDSNLTPKEVVYYSKNVGLIAIGVTDHDTTEGVQETIEEGKNLGIEVVPGVEISASFGSSAEEEIHILGYYIDWKNERLQDKLSYFRKLRIERAYKILSELKRLGMKISEEKIFSNVNTHSSIGRLHFARVLLEEKYVSSIKEAFELYLGYKRPAYVPKIMFSSKEAIEIVLQSKGIPVLAHPYISIYNDLSAIKELVKQGLKGIEVFHSKHHKKVQDELLLIADKYNLLITGGSDCHGKLDGLSFTLGSLCISYEYLENLKFYVKSNY